MIAKNYPRNRRATARLLLIQCPICSHKETINLPKQIVYFDWFCPICKGTVKEEFTHGQTLPIYTVYERHRSSLGQPIDERE